jgi:hypothetical protein
MTLQLNGNQFKMAVMQPDVCEIDLISDEIPQRKTKAYEGRKQLHELEGGKLRQLIDIRRLCRFYGQLIQRMNPCGAALVSVDKE